MCGQQQVRRHFPFEEEERKICWALLRATLEEGELVTLLVTV